MDAPENNPAVSVAAARITRHCFNDPVVVHGPGVFVLCNPLFLMSVYTYP